MVTLGKRVHGKIWLQRFSGAVILLSVAGGGLFAGSVFMKNGYILQGPITEKTPEGVVVEWPNGKVIIPRRFIESVALEPQEERRLKEKKAAAERNKAQQEEDDLLEVDYFLESNPEDLFPSKRLSGSESSVTRVKKRAVLPTVELGERREIFPGVTASLPQGWKLRREGDAWVVEGPPAAKSGHRARIAGTRLDSGLSRRSEITLAQQEAARDFEGWQVIEEGRREIGFHEGYEIYGRGNVDGTEYHVRRIIAWVGSKVWLFSCTWTSDADAAREIEWCLQTVEFTEESN